MHDNALIDPVRLVDPSRRDQLRFGRCLGIHDQNYNVRIKRFEEVNIIYGGGRDYGV